MTLALASGPARHLYEELADDLAGLIAKGALRSGDRLPSVRRLSLQRSVSVSTVLQAYVLLESRGLVETRPQSGHYVRAMRALSAEEPRSPRRSSQATRVSVSDLVAKVYGAARDPSMVLLGAAHMSPALLPTESINRRLASVARTAGSAGVAYDIPPGLPALRRQIARRAAENGVAIGADDVVTTFGAMEALHLCLRAVTAPGDTVLVETPAYYGILQLMESLGLRVLEIPANPGTGIDLELTAAALREHDVAACLLVPSFSNPLGALMPDDAKKALVAMLARREIPLIEDDIYGDLHFDPGPRPRPAKAYDKQGLVMLCSSFSKTLAPGYRVGYAVPGRFRDQVERLKFAQTVGTATLPQMAVSDFLENGGYDRHLRRLRRALAAQVARVSEAIVEHFPPGTRISRPRGGFVLWVEMPAGKSALDLHARALRHKISIAPGPIFSAKQRFSSCIRVSAGFPWSDTVARSIAKLGQIACEL
ncbi:MAG: PLP-dependent aminotransferase family protein [Polyangiaceae bacterium]|nr:PLP-dependent aminotransferase family protein [Polyangiaceae bacterium]